MTLTNANLYASLSGVDIPHVGHQGTVAGFARQFGGEMQVRWDAPAFQGSSNINGSDVTKEGPVDTTFKQNDIVRFVEDYGASAKKGMLAVVVSGVYVNTIGVRLLDGTPISCFPKQVEQVPGEWRSLSMRATSELEVGKDLVRPKLDLLGGQGASRERFLQGSVHVVKRVDQGFDVYLKDQDPNGTYAFYYTNFEVFVPTARSASVPDNDPKKAMTFATAAQYVVRLNELSGEAGIYRLRQRSWDKKGLYAAIDSGLVGPPARKLYTEQECKDEVARLEALQTPIDVPDEGSYGRHIFYTPKGECLLPGGYFTDADIKTLGGIVTFKGKRYRLCKRVTTLAPLVDNLTQTS